jgi:TolB-like protein/DNA-binding winged helix-turn-helix (wHTH) protein/Tfp pilus assembly protein PilF
MQERPGPARPPSRYRFGVFELDQRSGELRRAGARVRLAGQPLRVLETLLERPGELVTRDELRRELWSDDTFVDFEHNLNSAMKRLRAALGDTADNPRFVETLPRRGYRFIAPVERIAAEPPGPVAEAPDAASPAESQPPEPIGLPPAAVEPPRRSGRRRWIAFAVLLLAAGAAVLFQSTRGRPAEGYDGLAVLPFALANAASPDDEYLAFGLSEALVTQLSKLGGIRVVSQTSAMRYRGVDRPLPRIAGELGVDVVVEGSVQREENRVRITVQLIEAASDAHLWAETYEREMGSVLALVDDVALAVAAEVHGQIAGAGRQLPPRREVDPRVTEAYLKGRFHLSKANEQDSRRAVAYFEEALRLDPSHAPSHAGLADYYVVTDALEPAAAIERARFHATRALELDETLPDAHTSMAFLHFYFDWDWAAAGQAFRRALKIDPGHVRALRWQALFLSAMGRHDEALESIRRALAGDPVAIVNHDAAATVRLHARQFDDAADAGRAIHDLDSFDTRAHEQTSIALLHAGVAAQALEWADRGLAIAPLQLPLQLVRISALHRLGRTREAAREMTAFEAAGEGAYVSSVFVAVGLAAVERYDDAIDRLEQAYEERDAYLVLLNSSPWFDGLREDPRFARLLERLAFPSPASAF